MQPLDATIRALFHTFSPLRTPRNVHALLAGLQGVRDRECMGLKGSALPPEIDQFHVYVYVLLRDQCFPLLISDIEVGGEQWDCGRVSEEGLGGQSSIVVHGRRCYERAGGLIGAPTSENWRLDLRDEEVMLVWGDRDNVQTLSRWDQSRTALKAVCDEALRWNESHVDEILCPCSWLWDYSPDVHAVLVYAGGPPKPLLERVAECVDDGDVSALPVMSSTVRSETQGPLLPTAFAPLKEEHDLDTACEWWHEYLRVGADPDGRWADSRQKADDIEREPSPCGVWNPHDATDSMLVMVCEKEKLYFIDYESLYFLLHSDNHHVEQRDRLGAFVCRYGFECIHKRSHDDFSLGRVKVKDPQPGVEFGVVLFGLEPDAVHELVQEFDRHVCPITLTDIYLHKFVRYGEDQKGFSWGASKFIRRLPVAVVTSASPLRYAKSAPVQFDTQVEAGGAVTQYSVREASVHHGRHTLRSDDFPQCTCDAMVPDPKIPGLLRRKEVQHSMGNIFKSDRDRGPCFTTPRLLTEHMLSWCVHEGDITPELRAGEIVCCDTPKISDEKAPHVVALWNSLVLGHRSQFADAMLYSLVCRGVLVLPHWTTINRNHGTGYTLCGHGPQQTRRHTIVLRRPLYECIDNCD